MHGGVENSLSLTLRAKPIAPDRLRRALRNSVSLSLVLTVSFRLGHGVEGLEPARPGQARLGMTSEPLIRSGNWLEEACAVVGGVYVINTSGAPHFAVSVSAHLCSACASTGFIREKGRAPP